MPGMAVSFVRLECLKHFEAKVRRGLLAARCGFSKHSRNT